MQFLVTREVGTLMGYTTNIWEITMTNHNLTKVTTILKLNQDWKHIRIYQLPQFQYALNVVIILLSVKADVTIMCKCILSLNSSHDEGDVADRSDNLIEGTLTEFAKMCKVSNQ